MLEVERETDRSVVGWIVILRRLALDEALFLKLASNLLDAVGRLREAASGGVFTAGAHSFLDGVSNLLVDTPFDPRTLRTIVQRFVELGFSDDDAPPSRTEQTRRNR